MQTNTQPILLSWNAPSRPAYERSEKWYTVAGIVAVMLIAYGILSSAWTMSITVAIVSGLFYLVRNDQHVLHEIRISDGGVSFDAKFLSWPELKHFWILQGNGYYELHIEPKQKMLSDIVVLTGSVDPYQIIGVLQEFLPQIDHQKERLLDAIIRFCKL